MTATKTVEPMTPTAAGSEAWMPNGFPPPSFVVETERTRTFAGTRGRWLAAAAILGALLLIAGIVLIATDGDDTEVATGTTTTQFGGTNPTFPPTTGLDPTATLPNATVAPGGAVDPGGGTPVDPSATTAPPAPGGGGTAPPPAPGTPVGVLAASTGAIGLPKVDSTVGPVTGKVSLQNTGAGSLSYSTRSNFPGLTVDQPTGTIPPGGGTELTVTLNGAGAAEGPFNGILRFEGSGGTQEVRVTTTIGRPPVINDANPACAVEGTTCSRQIIATPASSNPCVSPWVYAVNVSDESTLTSVKADRPDPAADVPLKINGVTNGPGGAWRSDPQPALGPGATLTFTIEAVDQHGYLRRSTERKIVCPAA